MPDHPTPEPILKTAFGFMAAKTLLTAVQMDVFTELAAEPATVAEAEDRFDLDSRASADFLDALVAHGFLERDDGVYSPTPVADLYLDRQKDSYVGDFLLMANERLYDFWDDLDVALRTGEPQNEVEGDEDVFEAIYADDERLGKFLAAMSGLSLGPAKALAARFPWAEYDSMCDVGAAEGRVPVEVAAHHDHLTAAGFDLPKVESHFESFVAGRDVADRVTFHAGDFLEEPLPEADVLVMGHVLHDWDQETRELLLEKAHDALPEGGALVVYGPVVDDDRRENGFGLLMSLNILIETRTGGGYTGAECREWMRDAGFESARVEPLAGPVSIVVAEK